MSDLTEIFTDERLDQSETLRFTIPATSPKAYLLAPDHELEYEGRSYFVLEDEGDRDGTATHRRIEAPAAWYRLADFVLVGSRVLNAVTPADGLDAIIEETEWTRGPATTTDTATFTLEANDKSALELLREWAKITGKFITWDTMGRQVNLVDSRGADLGLGFRYGRNLRRVRKRSKPPEATVLYAYGADGLTIAGLNGGAQYVEDFTYYTDQGLTLEEARDRFTRIRVWSDSSFLIDADLFAAAQARLAILAAARVSYELDVVDLTELSIDSGDIAVGDTVRVQDPAFADDLRTTVVRYVRHRKQPWRNRVELATLQPVLRDGSSSGRPSRSSEWVRFDGPIGADLEIRDDGVFDVARIPLAFRQGGRAHFFVDVAMTGAGGASTVTAYIYDALADLVVNRPVVVTVADGVTSYARILVALDEIPSGSFDYRVRLEPVSDTSPDPTIGVDVPGDMESEVLGVAASFYIMTQGAIYETPTVENSVTFNTNGDNTDTGEVQLWEVPAGVTEITVEAHGGAGGSNVGLSQLGGRGARIVGLFAVTPGDEYEIYVGKQGSCDGVGPGWPNGGTGGNGSAGDDGPGGGGSTSMRPLGGTFADSLIIAAAGGGASIGGPEGGDGGWIHGEDGEGAGGEGATQSVPGTGTTHPDNTSYGAAGGDGVDASADGYGGNAASFVGVGTDGAGGGGGGRCGGGGGGGTGPSAGAGGGGASWIAPGGILLEAEDGGAELVGGEDANGGGKLIISWDTPA
jgi:phage minor structural protein